jgi:peptidoglycan/xylan/chitin deacetylase (PgdA/CDA1 family)
MSPLVKRLAAKACRPFSYFLTLHQLKATEGAGLICPVYHICRSTRPHWWGDRYRIKTVAELQADLELLASIGSFISIEEMLDYRHGRRPRPQGIFLSFDDGYRELYDEIAPLLQKLGIPATFFVISSLIDNANPFHEDIAGAIRFRLSKSTKATQNQAVELCLTENKDLNTILQLRTPDWPLLEKLCEVVEFDTREWLAAEQPYLTTAQLRNLAKSGFEVGAHSVDHPLFSEIDGASRSTQVSSSAAAITMSTGKPCRSFAFPYGEFGISQHSLELLVLKSGVDLFFGTRGVTFDEFEPNLIQRMLAEDHPESFRQHIHHELRLQLHRTWLGRATVHRKQ